MKFAIKGSALALALFGARGSAFAITGENILGYAGDIQATPGVARHSCRTAAPSPSSTTTPPRANFAFVTDLNSTQAIAHDDRRRHSR